MTHFSHPDAVILLPRILLAFAFFDVDLY